MSSLLSLGLIEERLRQAQREGNEIAVSTLRLALAAAKNQEIEKRSKGNNAPLDERELLGVFQREAKKRREAIEAFRKGGRENLANKEEKELAVISEYLPAQLSREEVKAAVREIAKGGGDFNAVMKQAMANLKGRADGKLVGEIAKEILGP